MKLSSLKPRSVAQKLCLYIGTAICIVLIISASHNYIHDRNTLMNLANNEAFKQVEAGARQIDDVALSVSSVTESLVAYQKALGDSPEKTTGKFLVDLLEKTSPSEVYGIYIAYDKADWRKSDACLAVHRKGWPKLTPVLYDFHDTRQEWYSGPRKSGKLYVTDPYFDEGAGDITMLSITAPIYDEKGKFVGVAGSDMSLEAIRNFVSGVKFRSDLTGTDFGEGYEFTYLVSRQGKVIVHPNEKLMLGKDFAGEDVTKLECGREIMYSPKGNGSFVKDGKAWRVYWTQTPFTKWKVVLNVREDVILAPVYSLSRKWLIFIPVTMFFMISLMLLIARKVMAPVGDLMKASQQLEEGIYNPALLDRAAMKTDELGRLARAFQKMEIEIQQRKQRLEEWSQTLEQTVKERTAELEKKSQEAEEARLEAEAANKTKSSFLASMSHELRTPMNAIIGYSEMLMEEAEDDGNDDYLADLKKIHAAGKHLLSLINDILDLSKIEAGKMDLYLETFDVASVINDVVATIQPLVEKNSNTLNVECQAGLGSMHADLTKVRQGLFNLLSNACKFTKNGAVGLKVSRDERDGNTWFTFDVTDSGIGITPEQMKKLFKAFTQADSSTTRQFGGTGLGLNITKHFCQMMGGDVTVTSEYGKGSTFTITLPATVVDPKLQKGEGGQASSEEQTADDSLIQQENTVLIIDDDPASRELISRHLSKEGFSVIAASGGKEGIAMAREKKPFVITLDVMMPEMDGWAVLSALKSDPELASIPVIMQTFVNEKEMGYALGVSDYVTKPVDREKLVEILTKHRHSNEQCVLLVEDDSGTREMMRQILRKGGASVCEAENGKVALKRMKEKAPGLIFLDLMMPEMDGFTFLEEMRKEDEWKNIPVVVVTAKDITADERARLSAKVERIMNKGSFSRDEVVGIMNRFLKKVAPHRAAEDSELSGDCASGTSSKPETDNIKEESAKEPGK